MLLHPAIGRRIATACLTLLLVACQTNPATPWLQAGSSLALSPDGRTLAVANPDLPVVTLVDTASLDVRASFEAGTQPRSVAFTPDGSTLISAASDGQVTFANATSGQLLGSLRLAGQPFCVVTTARRAYVSLFALGQVAVIDLAARSVVEHIAVEPFPAGLAVTDEALFVTHFYSGRVTRLNLSTLSSEGAITPDRHANLSLGVALARDGRTLYLPQTLSLADNPNLSAQSTVKAAVNVLTTAALAPVASLELSSHHGPANLPLAAVVSPDARWLLVASGGTDAIVVLDLRSGEPVTNAATGAYPSGLALSADGARLFVNNALDAMVTVFEVGYPNAAEETMPRLSPGAVISVGTLPLAPDVLLGKRLFNSALPPMGEGRIACASCHFEGGHDARTWLGFPDGPRNTPPLWAARHTAPYHWSGDRPALQDVELTIRDIQHGQGFLRGAAQAGDTAGRSAELDALAAYMAALDPPPSPFAIDSDTRRRGEIAFSRWGCASCHSGDAFTDRTLHELTTDRIGEAALQHNPRGLAFDTPGLLGAWASGPYFHDGSSATLRDTLFRSGFHGMGWAMDKQEVEDVLALMRALPIRGDK